MSQFKVPYHCSVINNTSSLLQLFGTVYQGTVYQGTAYQGTVYQGTVYQGTVYQGTIPMQCYK